MQAIKFYKLICFLFLVILANATPSQAKIAQVLCIKKINEILKHLPPSGETVAIFDWDQTISSEEGEYILREVAHDGTLQTLQNIHNRGIKTIVLTARGQGLDLSSKMIQMTVKPMLQTLGDTWILHGALKSNDYMKEENRALEAQARLYILALNQIVFAGGGVKGNAMATLIDKDKFKKKPENIIFVDNDEKNKDNVIKVFADRPENVFIFHYPNPQGRIAPDKACAEFQEFPIARGHLFIPNQEDLDNAKIKIKNDNAKTEVEIKSDWGGKFSFRGPPGEWHGIVERDKKEYSQYTRQFEETGEKIRYLIKFVVDHTKAVNNNIDLGTIFVTETR